MEINRRCCCRRWGICSGRLLRARTGAQGRARSSRAGRSESEPGEHSPMFAGLALSANGCYQTTIDERSTIVRGRQLSCCCWYRAAKFFRRTLSLPRPPKSHLHSRRIGHRAIRFALAPFTTQKIRLRSITASRNLRLFLGFLSGRSGAS